MATAKQRKHSNKRDDAFRKEYRLAMVERGIRFVTIVRRDDNEDLERILASYSAAFVKWMD